MNSYKPITMFTGAVRRRPRLTAVILLAVAAGLFFAAWHGRGWYHYLAATRALQHRDFAAALDHLAVCRQLWPASASTQLLAARAARRAGRLDEAEACIETCRRLGGPAEEGVLEDYLLQAQRGRLDQVEKKLLAFLQKDHPRADLVLETLTGLWIKTYELDRALGHLELWLKLQPENREALVRKGWVLEHLADLPGSIGSYEKALMLDPDRDRQDGDRLRLRLAELLLKQKRTRDAARQLEILHERQPDHTTVLLGLARCRFLEGNAEEADRLLETVLAQRPDDGPALGERGRIALARGQAGRAELLLRKAVAAQPRDKATVSAFLGCLRRLGKADEAKTYAKRLQEIQDDEHAMAQLMREITQAPDDARLRCEAGRIFLRNGFAEDGCRWLQLALTCDPAYRPAHRALAEYYESTGERAKARLHRQAAQ